MRQFTRMYDKEKGLAQPPHRGCDCCGPISRRAALQTFACAAATLTLPIDAKAEAYPNLIEPRLTLRPSTDGIHNVALTLDACPGGFDGKILKALIDWRVPATIFMTGAWIHSNSDAVRLIMQHPALFAIGNHGAHHIPAVIGRRSVFGLRVAGDLDAVRAEITNGEDAIRKATGITPHWYRGATALYSPSVVPTIESLGLSIAGFSINGDDGASLSASGVVSRFKQARDGAVIIAHVNQPHRPSGAGVIAGVRELLNRNMRFVRLDGSVPSVVAL